jgi:hypothetical protein
MNIRLLPDKCPLILPLLDEIIATHASSRSRGLKKTIGSNKRMIIL